MICLKKGRENERVDLMGLFIVLFGVIGGVISLWMLIAFAAKRKPLKRVVITFVAMNVITLVGLLVWGSDADAPDTETANVGSTESRRSQEEQSSIEAESERLAVTFDEIYKAYKANELRADDKYKNNRYRITARISAMTNDGLFNYSGGATLTMETRVDNTVVFFYAEFEREQEDALKNVDVGDLITFEGECLSAGSWVNCEIVS